MPGGVNGPPITSGGPYVYPNKTLGQLRTEVLIRLGFMDRLAVLPTRTLAALRQNVIDALGLPDPLNLTSGATRNFVELRDDVSYALGYAQSTRPAGFTAMLDRWVEEANQRVWRRLEMDNGQAGGTPPPRLSPAGTPTYDYVPIQLLAIALAKAHYQQPDAKIYFDQLEQYFADRMRRRPPNLDDTVNRFLKEAQQTIYRRHELGVTTFALAAFEVDGDSTTIDYRPVLALATADTKAWLKQPDARRYYDEVERYFADLQRRKPPEADGIVTNALRDAQEQLYFDYTSLRGDQWWKWDLVAGERFYDVVKSGTINLDLRKVQSVWIVDGNGIWQEIHEGINPNDFSVDTPGMPYAYELREYIEIWPAPDGPYQLYLFGHLGLKSFTLDNDTATIDYHAIFLKALAVCKAHFGQRDAAAIDRDAMVHVGRLNARSHGNRRYIPNENVAGAVVGGVDYGSNIRFEEGGNVRRMEPV